jgi:hypothetical protein
MTHNIAKENPLPILQQHPRLSDDSETEKQRSIPTVSNPVPHDRIGSGAGVQKKVSK